MNPLKLPKTDAKSAGSAGDGIEMALFEPTSLSLAETTKYLQMVRSRLLKLVVRFRQLDAALKSVSGKWSRTQANAVAAVRGGEQLRGREQLRGLKRINRNNGLIRCQLPTIPEENEDEISEGDS